MASKDLITIYHNPRCGKSRSALTILTEHGIDPVVVEYLNRTPDRGQRRPGDDRPSAGECAGDSLSHKFQETI